MTKLIVTKRLQPMLNKGIVPYMGGVFIDTYNKSIQNVCPTLLADKQDCMHGHLYVTTQKQNDMEKLDKSKMKNVRIRKLTNRECYRFMGVPEERIDQLLASDISVGGHYHLAGNSIVMPVLREVFRNIFFADQTNGMAHQLSLL